MVMMKFEPHIEMPLMASNDAVGVEGRLQSVHGAVDDARVEPEQKPADGGHQHNENHKTRFVLYFGHTAPVQSMTRSKYAFHAVYASALSPSAGSIVRLRSSVWNASSNDP